MNQINKLKIAVWHNLPSGGGKRALYEHVRGLTARGHTVEAWCPQSADSKYLPLDDFIDEHVLPFDWQEPAATGRISRMTSRYKAITTKLEAMERHCAACAREIEAGSFDVLFANSCMFFRVPPIGRMVGRLPALLYLQEPYRWLYEALPVLPWPALPRATTHPLRPRNVKSFLNNLIHVQGMRVQMREEYKNAGSYDEVLVNSFFSRESVLRAYGIDAHVCYLGVTSDALDVTAQERERFVLGLGSLTYEKGVDIAVRALATIEVDRRPELVWVGNVASARYLEEMKTLAAELGVRLTPRMMVSDQELREIAGRAAVLIYTARLEPFGFAPLEANALGTPVVAVAEGGVRETVHDEQNGLLVPGRDPEAIGRAVLRMLDDREFAKACGARGREGVRARWTWDAAVDRLEERLRRAARHNSS